MYYKCTKCKNKQTNKIKCDICQERTLYIIHEYPQDTHLAKHPGHAVLALWKGDT